MKKLAVIIIHSFRESDVRVDIIEVPEDTTYDEVHYAISRDMIGPFQVAGITDKVNLTRKIDITKDVKQF